MDFSEKLLTLRKAKNLTQEELAEKLLGMCCLCCENEIPVYEL